MQNLKLTTSAGSTAISIGGGFTLPGQFDPERTIVLADENYLKFHKDKFKGFQVISVGSGEGAKSMENAVKLYHRLLEAEVDRTWSVIGAGGGITTDLAGFVASTFMRGVRFGFVSTTLLGQVDAAIGGKNGVNLDGYKNMIGVIRQPDFVFCDTDSLSSLPDKEFLGGFAEIIKYGAIRDRSFYDFLEQYLEKGIARDTEILEKMIFESVRNKIEVVQADEHETGERKILNFGHTFAHAFEKLYKIPHGEAVASGMILAARLSANLKLIDDIKAESLVCLIKRSGISIYRNFEPYDLAEAMKKDKKRAGKEIKFVLLESIGKAVIKEIPVSDLKSVLYDLR
jgi:3-dehydroquinate synthase